MTDQPNLQPQPQIYMTPNELAARWRVSVRSLERWRMADRGPAWISIGGGIRYPVDAVIDHEEQHRLVPARVVVVDHDDR